MAVKRRRFDSPAATQAGLDYLLRKDARRATTTAPVSSSSGTGTTFTGPIEPTFLVASSTASAAMKAVADFVCDGSDDDLEIQFALDSLPTAGGRVMLTEGTFSCPTTIVIPTGATLEGVGWATFLDKVGFADQVIEIAASAVNTAILNLRIDGNTESAIRILTGVTDLTVKGCHLSNTGASWPTIHSTAGATRVWILDNFFESASSGESCVKFETVIATQVIIRGNHIEAGQIMAHDVTECIIDGNVMLNSGIEAGIGGTFEGIISNNYIFTTDFGGIEANGTGVISGNVIKDSNNDGIIIVSGSGAFDIYGNYLQDCVSFAAGYDQVILNGTGSYFHGNIINDSLGFGEYGVHILGTDIIMGDNEYGSGHSIDVINDAGTNTVWKDKNQQVWTMAGVLSVKTGKLKISFEHDIEILEVFAEVDGVPTGTDVQVDLHMDAVTLFTTQANRPIITVAGGIDNDSAVPDITFVPTTSVLTMDVDQIDSNAISTNLSVMIRYREGFG